MSKTEFKSPIYQSEWQEKTHLYGLRVAFLTMIFMEKQLKTVLEEVGVEADEGFIPFLFCQLGTELDNIDPGFVEAFCEKTTLAEGSDFPIVDSIEDLKGVIEGPFDN